MCIVSNKLQAIFNRCWTSNKNTFIFNINSTSSTLKTNSMDGDKTCNRWLLKYTFDAYSS